MSQDEQKYAIILLHDIQRGDIIPGTSKTFRDYITDYLSQAKDAQIHKLGLALGLDEKLLKDLMALGVTESNINEFGRLDKLKETVDKALAKAFFERVEKTKIIPPKVGIKVDNFLRKFILSGGFDIED